MSEVLPSQKSDLLPGLDPGGSGRNAGSAGGGANRGLGRVCVPHSLAILLLVPAVRGFAELFLLWFGALSVQEFTGYLMTGPFFAMGDIGSALHLLAAPLWISWLLFLVGELGTLLLGRLFTSRLLRLVDPVGGNRPMQLRCLGLFAWLLGVVLILGYGFGEGFVVKPSHGIFTPVALIEVLATLTSGVFVFAVRFFMGAEVRERPISVSLGWPVALPCIGAPGLPGCRPRNSSTPRQPRSGLQKHASMSATTHMRLGG
jgi:hypothetical protein